jgi:hypothetical protein
MTVIVSGCCPGGHRVDAGDVRIVPTATGTRIVSCPLEIAALEAA